MRWDAGNYARSRRAARVESMMRPRQESRHHEASGRQSAGILEHRCRAPLVPKDPAQRPGNRARRRELTPRGSGRVLPRCCFRLKIPSDCGRALVTLERQERPFLDPSQAPFHVEPALRPRTHRASRQAHAYGG